ncbi:hypothetical protein BLD48_09685 [Exiguobacterium sp. KRL4]|uniref:DUF4256 domain-containing protein n=1 Tax=Exiguobacterium sp. KRL4 TaxID=1914536 RepID=UPI0008F8E00A|nr:DUF4256 domain-containing protein [Exiguobacterium sp. KRL4]OIN66581.1 hypothetical protein BLD48_09685 [Exiguobacterium sp. KRL4]
MMNDFDMLQDSLQKRFGAHIHRHPTVEWNEIQTKLSAATLRSLDWMEQSGGEPDVVSMPDGRLLVIDCAPESPTGRRSLCYDDPALEKRKKNKPAGSAVATATAHGVSLLTEDDYRHLQTLGEFDLKTSSWIETPETIRAQGGALFCDRRYDHIFVYHNRADSYYANRGFRTYVVL